MLLTIFFYTFLFIVGVQLFFYAFLFRKFSFYPRKKTQKSNLSISVIIASKNEAINLRENLPIILNQKHPNFEVIVINDASTDLSLEVLNHFQKEHKHLKVINLAPSIAYQGNKKNALSKGIKIASYDYLLFTDADCKPISENWITVMADHFIDKKQIILGYGAYKRIKSSLLNKLIRYETLLTAIQYFSYAKMGIPYMGVGRNLAYKKELFLKNNGFENHKYVKSGDDDLFVNEIACNINTEICFNQESFTISEPKRNFETWFLQKRRHISTATKYKPIHQFLLGLFFISQFLFWSLAIILLIFTFNWQVVTILVVIRIISQYIIVKGSAKKLNETDLVLLTPLLDFLMVFVQISLFFSNIISKPKHW